MAKKIRRIYGKIDDNSMLGQASVMHRLFVGDKAEYISFDNSFSDPFAANWLAKIEAALDCPADSSVRYIIAEDKEITEARWEACREHFRDARYFIKKAFPRNAGMRNAFGFKDFRAMSRSKKNVVTFMSGFHYMATRFNVELIGAGYTQAKIDAIITLSDAFDEADGNMHGKKKSRGVETSERITLMNNVWEDCQRVNRASKEVYKNDFAKRKQYLLAEK